MWKVIWGNVISLGRTLDDPKHTHSPSIRSNTPSTKPHTPVLIPPTKEQTTLRHIPLDRFVSKPPPEALFDKQSTVFKHQDGSPYIHSVMPKKESNEFMCKDSNNSYSTTLRNQLSNSHNSIPQSSYPFIEFPLTEPVPNNAVSILPHIKNMARVPSYKRVNHEFNEKKKDFMKKNSFMPQSSTTHLHAKESLHDKHILHSARSNSVTMNLNPSYYKNSSSLQSQYELMNSSEKKDIQQPLYQNMSSFKSQMHHTPSRSNTQIKQLDYSQAELPHVIHPFCKPLQTVQHNNLSEIKNERCKPGVQHMTGRYLHNKLPNISEQSPQFNRASSTNHVDNQKPSFHDVRHNDILILRLTKQFKNQSSIQDSSACVLNNSTNKHSSNLNKNNLINQHIHGAFPSRTVTSTIYQPHPIEKRNRQDHLIQETLDHLTHRVGCHDISSLSKTHQEPSHMHTLSSEITKKHLINQTSPTHHINNPNHLEGVNYHQLFPFKHCTSSNKQAPYQISHRGNVSSMIDNKNGCLKEQSGTISALDDYTYRHDLSDITQKTHEARYHYPVNNPIHSTYTNHFNHSHNNNQLHNVIYPTQHQIMFENNNLLSQNKSYETYNDKNTSSYLHNTQHEYPSINCQSQPSLHSMYPTIEYTHTQPNIIRSMSSDIPLYLNHKSHCQKQNIHINNPNGSFYNHSIHMLNPKKMYDPIQSCRIEQPHHISFQSKKSQQFNLPTNHTRNKYYLNSIAQQLQRLPEHPTAITRSNQHIPFNKPYDPTHHDRAGTVPFNECPPECMKQSICDSECILQQIPLNADLKTGMPLHTLGYQSFNQDKHLIHTTGNPNDLPIYFDHKRHDAYPTCNKSINQNDNTPVTNTSNQLLELNAYPHLNNSINTTASYKRCPTVPIQFQKNESERYIFHSDLDQQLCTKQQLHNINNTVSESFNNSMCINPSITNILPTDDNVIYLNPITPVQSSFQPIYIVTHENNTLDCKKATEDTNDVLHHNTLGDIANDNDSEYSLQKRLKLPNPVSRRNGNTLVSGSIQKENVTKPKKITKQLVPIKTTRVLTPSNDKHAGNGENKKQHIVSSLIKRSHTSHIDTTHHQNPSRQILKRINTDKIKNKNDLCSHLKTFQPRTQQDKVLMKHTQSKLNHTKNEKKSCNEIKWSERQSQYDICKAVQSTLCDTIRKNRDASINHLNVSNHTVSEKVSLQPNADTQRAIKDMSSSIEQYHNVLPKRNKTSDISLLTSRIPRLTETRRTVVDESQKYWKHSRLRHSTMEDILTEKKKKSFSQKLASNEPFNSQTQDAHSFKDKTEMMLLWQKDVFHLKDHIPTNKETNLVNSSEVTLPTTNIVSGGLVSEDEHLSKIVHVCTNLEQLNETIHQDTLKLDQSESPSNELMSSVLDQDFISVQNNKILCPNENIPRSDLLEKKEPNCIVSSPLSHRVSFNSIDFTSEDSKHRVCKDLAELLLHHPTTFFIRNPSLCFIMKRDKEFRKIKRFGWDTASTNIKQIIPSLSRYTLEHQCDTSGSHIIGLNGKRIICQNQLLAQIGFGLPIRDIFSNYLKSQVTHSLSIEDRINRYIDKRRIQNTTRRFLEALLLDHSFFETFNILQQDIDIDLNSSSNILLCDMVYLRKIVLQHIFHYLKKEFITLQMSINENKLSSDSLSFTLQDFTTIVSHLNLWPKEMVFQDCDEIVKAIGTSTDLLQSNSFCMIPPSIITETGFITTLLVLPYNLPEFPLPLVHHEVLSSNPVEEVPPLTDRELVLISLCLCQLLLTVNTTQQMLEYRDQVLIANASAMYNDDTHATQTSNDTNLIETAAKKRLDDLTKNEYSMLGLPPLHFISQDILMSSLISVEEIQTLLILYINEAKQMTHFSTQYSLINQLLFPEHTTPLAPYTKFVDIRIISRCLNIICGLTIQLLTESNWLFLMKPFSPLSKIPRPTEFIQRAYTLRDKIDLISTVRSSVQESSVCKFEECLQTSNCHLSHESFYISDTNKELCQLELNNGGTQSTSTSSLPVCDDIKIEHRMTDTQFNYKKCLNYEINWKSILNNHTPPLTPLPVVESKNYDSIKRNPFLHNPRIQQGSIELWNSITTDIDLELIAAITTDPSGFVPYEVATLQICCSIFQTIAHQTDCFGSCLNKTTFNKFSQHEIRVESDTSLYNNEM